MILKSFDDNLQSSIWSLYAQDKLLHNNKNSIYIKIGVFLSFLWIGMLCTLVSIRKSDYFNEVSKIFCYLFIILCIFQSFHIYYYQTVVDIKNVIFFSLISLFLLLDIITPNPNPNVKTKILYFTVLNILKVVLMLFLINVLLK